MKNDRRKARRNSFLSGVGITLGVIAAGLMLWAGTAFARRAANAQQEGAQAPAAQAPGGGGRRGRGFGNGVGGGLGPTRMPEDNAQMLVPEENYLHWPLPPGDQAYSWVNGEDIKKIELEVVAISEQSKADGNQMWGRVVGTKYDHMSADWFEARMKKLGLDVHREEQKLPLEWFPNSWQANYSAGGKTVNLDSAMPVSNSVGTPNGAIEADAAWVGYGSGADFKGRDLKGKAVLIYSWPTPGGRNNTGTAGGANGDGPMKRAQDAGAAMIILVLGFPGNSTDFGSIGQAPTVPTFYISDDQGTAIREAIEKDQSPKVSLNLKVSIEPGHTTQTTYAVLPGQTDEKVIFVAHHDCYFDGALDNASGMALVQYIAAHYASLPKAQRKRTMVFLDTPMHHGEPVQGQPDVGDRWVMNHFTDLFPKTALIINCEHTAQMQPYFVGSGIMTSDNIEARRWFAAGSDTFKKLVTGTLREFGVATYTVMEPSPGGELALLHTKAPCFHIIDQVFYHTSLDTPDWTPANGMESVARAYFKIVDTANKMTAAEIKGDYKTDSDSGN